LEKKKFAKEGKKDPPTPGKRGKKASDDDRKKKREWISATGPRNGRKTGFD